MGIRWGADDEGRIMGCHLMDSGRQRWQDKEQVSGYYGSVMSTLECARGGVGKVKVSCGSGTE